MGILIAKFSKKKTTVEVLEKLENEIHSIEEFRRNTEQAQKKMVGRFIFISFSIYCITALVLYFYFFPVSAYEKAIYITPLILVPVLLILIKRVLSWYYNRKIRKNERKLSSLKDQKKKILDEVMDKETYKTAKTILEKYAPEHIKKNNFSIDNTPIKTGSITSISSSNQTPLGLRYRGQLATPGINRQLALSSGFTPKPQQLSLMSQTPAKFSSPQNVISNVRSGLVSGTPLLLPRAILPRERSVLDKMVDYLVGDGPSNRYALICRNCSSHNGMALKEEFDYLSFRCCYCGNINPSRKKRPSAPKLEFITLPESTDADDQSNSDSDAEGGRPIITEPSSDCETDNKITNISDSEKLSDIDQQNFDSQPSAMEVDSIPDIRESSEKMTNNGIQED